MSYASESYVEFLKSEQWAAIKKQVRDRARASHEGKLCCELCHTDDPDNGKDRTRGFWQTAHVKGYRGNWADTPISDLRNVCRKCHEELDGFRGKTSKSFVPYKQAPQKPSVPVTNDLDELLGLKVEWL
jgi:hypothetical protein